MEKFSKHLVSYEADTLEWGSSLSARKSPDHTHEVITVSTGRVNEGPDRHNNHRHGENTVNVRLSRAIYNQLAHWRREVTLEFLFVLSYCVALCNRCTVKEV